jgi:hypothetical protein
VLSSPKGWRRWWISLPIYDCSVLVVPRGDPDRLREMRRKTICHVLNKSLRALWLVVVLFNWWRPDGEKSQLGSNIACRRPRTMVSHRQAARANSYQFTSYAHQLSSARSSNPSPPDTLPYGFPRPPTADSPQISAPRPSTPLRPASPRSHHPSPLNTHRPSSPRSPRPRPITSRPLRTRHRPSGGATLRSLYAEVSPSPVARAALHVILEKRRRREQVVSLCRELNKDANKNETEEFCVSHGSVCVCPRWRSYCHAYRRTRRTTTPLKHLSWPLQMKHASRT